MSSPIHQNHPDSSEEPISSETETELRNIIAAKDQIIVQLLEKTGELAEFIRKEQYTVLNLARTLADEYASYAEFVRQLQKDHHGEPIDSKE